MSPSSLFWSALLIHNPFLYGAFLLYKTRPSPTANPTLRIPRSLLQSAFFFWLGILFPVSPGSLIQRPPPRRFNGPRFLFSLSTLSGTSFRGFSSAASFSDVFSCQCDVPWLEFYQPRSSSNRDPLALHFVSRSLFLLTSNEQ